jgi:hypothetical protein
MICAWLPAGAYPSGDANVFERRVADSLPAYLFNAGFRIETFPSDWCRLA